jgi:hypothetical protein
MGLGDCLNEYAFGAPASEQDFCAEQFAALERFGTNVEPQ